jgi:hypothetical protein
MDAVGIAARKSGDWKTIRSGWEGPHHVAESASVAHRI